MEPSQPHRPSASSDPIRLRRDLAEAEARVLVLEQEIAAHRQRVATLQTALAKKGRAATHDATVIRGAEIRARAIEVLLKGPDPDAPIHYRRWFSLLEEGGYAIVGRRPEAIFLNQITRSPLVRPTTRAGVYQLDRDSGARLTKRLVQTRARLLSVVSTDGPMGAADAQDRRYQLLGEVTQLERELAEAAQVLGFGPVVEREDAA